MTETDIPEPARQVATDEQAEDASRTDPEAKPSGPKPSNPWWHESAASYLGASPILENLPDLLEELPDASGMPDFLKQTLADIANAFKEHWAVIGSIQSVRGWTGGITSALPEGTTEESSRWVNEAVCPNCPVCQGLTALRSVRPDLADKASFALLSVASTLRGDEVDVDDEGERDRPSAPFAENISVD